MPFIQTAWVVRDLQETMSQWLNLGVGPFYTLDVDLPSVKYRGEESSLSMLIGMVQAGSVQLEFIQQTSGKPSAYTDGETSGAANFHHICRDYGGYDEAVAKLEAQGAALATEAQWGDCRFCYVDARDTLGCFIELCDDTETGRKMYEIVREGAENWDGKDPIRSLAPLLA
jgi:hypothetical protein